VAEWAAVIPLTFSNSFVIAVVQGAGFLAQAVFVAAREAAFQVVGSLAAGFRVAAEAVRGADSPALVVLEALAGARVVPEAAIAAVTETAATKLRFLNSSISI
jgi:hypothetical protein